MFDAILYINLAHRTDRKEHVLNEIHKICTDDTTIHRIDGILHTNGCLGCSLSHIRALEYALEHPEWKLVLVLEDDFTFKGTDEDEIASKIATLLQNSPNFDVTLLSHNPIALKCSDTSNPEVKKVIFSQTTSSYIVKREYINTLLANMREGAISMARYGRRYENYLDIHWTKLQRIDNWYTIFPAIGYQYANHSDVENKYCAHGC